MKPIILSLLLFLVPNADSQLYVRLNQLGFAPDQPKTAIIFSRDPLPAEFQVVNVQGSAVVFTGAVKTIDGSWGHFDHHGELDFSAFRQEGSDQLKYLLTSSNATAQMLLAYQLAPDKRVSIIRS